MLDVQQESRPAEGDLQMYLRVLREAPHGRGPQMLVQLLLRAAGETSRLEPYYLKQKARENFLIPNIAT